MTRMAKKFSSLLVQNSVVSIEKMEEALQRQVIFGGRLGTNLLEMGVISEAELVHYLAMAHNTRPAETNHYTNLDPDAIGLLDIETVERLNLLPIRIHPGKQVDALVVDPLEPQILEGLQRMTEYEFVQFIAPEFRFLQALNQFFGRELPRRFERLINRFPQQMRLGTSSHLGHSVSKSNRTLSIQAIKLPHESQDQELHSPLGAPSSNTATATVIPRDMQLGLGWDPTEVSDFLSECYSRDTCLELLLGYSGNFAQRRVLLVVARNRLQGYIAAGLRDPDDRIRRFKLPIPEQSLLDQVCKGDNCYQGDPEGVNIDILYQSFDQIPPEQIVLIPIRVGPRAGLLLLLDDNDLYIDIESLNPLFKVVSEVSTALERIIKLMKRKELPPSELRIPPLPARYRRQQNVGKPPTSRSRRPATAPQPTRREALPLQPEATSARPRPQARPESPDRPRAEQPSRPEAPAPSAATPPPIPTEAAPVAPSPPTPATTPAAPPLPTVDDGPPDTILDAPRVVSGDLDAPDVEASAAPDLDAPDAETNAAPDLDAAPARTDEPPTPPPSDLEASAPTMLIPSIRPDDLDPAPSDHSAPPSDDGAGAPAQPEGDARPPIPAEPDLSLESAGEQGDKEPDLFKPSDAPGSILKSDFDVGWDLPDDFDLPDLPDFPTDAEPKASAPASTQADAAPQRAAERHDEASTEEAPAPSNAVEEGDEPSSQGGSTMILPALALGRPGTAKAPKAPEPAPPAEDPAPVLELGGPDAPSFHSDDPSEDTPVLELGGPDAPSFHSDAPSEDTPVLELGGPDAPSFHSDAPSEDNPAPELDAPDAPPAEDPAPVLELGGPDAPSFHPDDPSEDGALLELGGPDAPSFHSDAPSEDSALPEPADPDALSGEEPEQHTAQEPGDSDKPELLDVELVALEEDPDADDPDASGELARPPGSTEPGYQVRSSSGEEFPSLFDEVKDKPPETPRINADGTLKPPPPSQPIKAMVPQPTKDSGLHVEATDSDVPQESTGDVPEIEPEEIDLLAIEPELIVEGEPESEEGAPERVPSLPPGASPPSEDVELIDAGTLELEVLSDDEILEDESLAEDEVIFDPETAAALKRYRPVVKQLASTDPLEVSSATDLLMASGGMALPALLEQFPGPIRLDHYSYSVTKLPPVEQHGPLLSILVQLGDLAAPAISTFFEHPSVEIRFYSTFYFTRVRYEPVLGQLVKRLFDRDSQIRGVARLIIRSYRGSPSYREVLRQIHYILHSSQDTWMLEQASLAIGALAETRAVPQLIELLESPHHRVSDSVHRALCQIAFEDLGKNKRKWSRWWREHSQDDRTRWLIEALNHGKPRIRELAAEELHHMPGLLVNYSPYGPKPQRLRAQKIVAQYLQDHSHG
ncbi:MAG: hypothetical protein CMH57_14640 [Myxococcales bacterium]|nr:hypothetical protein [Myxococcales bacterium]